MAKDNYVQAGLMGAKREDLEKYAKHVGVKFTKKTDDLTLAQKTHEVCMTCDDEMWNSLPEGGHEWANALQEKLNEIAAAAPEEAATDDKEAEETGAAPTAEEILDGCKTKKAVVEAAKELGCGLKIVMSWKLADMKAKVLESLAASDGLEAEAEKPTPPARTAANAKAPEPSPAQVERAKATARTTATEAKKKGGARKIEEGEPCSRNTTAWLIWDVIRKAKKPLKVAEIKERYLKAFEAADEVKSSNPEGRLAPVLGWLKRDGICIPGKEKGTYEPNPEWNGR